MDQQQIDATRREFDRIDTDRDGYITIDEAMRWGFAQGQQAREILGRHIQQDRGVDSDGQVSFEEFLSYKEQVDS